MILTLSLKSMVSDIDQFGRDTTKNNNPSFNEEKSKKILDSLAEIKNQLENKDYNPNFDDVSPKIKVSNSRDNSCLLYTSPSPRDQ